MAETPWDLAYARAEAAGVALRSLESLEEGRLALDVVEATWGRADLVSAELMRAFQAAGDPPIGAFDGSRLVGFVLGFFGAGPDGLHLHSHMLAVLPDRRASGVGHALKLAQRAAALDAGVHLARWTFDPLVARNAYFNLVKLGAVADRFQRGFYGEMTDLLNRGDRSDRLEARWDLDPEPGRRPPSGPPAASVVLARGGTSETPVPGEVRDPEAAPAVVEVPENYLALRDRDPVLAREWRERAAEALERCFGAGLVATSFLRTGAYVFTSPGDQAP